MSAEEIKFISYQEAVKLVGAIQEEEDVDTPENAFNGLQFGR